MAARGERFRKAGRELRWSRPRSVAATLIPWSCAVASAIGFIYAIGIGLDFRDRNRSLVGEGLQAARALADQEQARIDGALGRVAATIAEAAARLPKDGRPDEADLLAVVRDVIYSNPGFAEAGVAFAPFAYDRKIRLYGVSYVVDEEGTHLRDLDVDQDYTKTGADWYFRPLAGTPTWLEPRYDEARRQMLAIYAAPIFMPQGAAKPAGVVFATYALRRLRRALDAPDFGENGYSFLLSASRRFILHPNRDYVNRRWTLEDFLDRLPDRSAVAAVRAALNDPSRIARFTDPDTGQEARMFFRRIPAAAATLGVVLVDRDMLMPSGAAHETLIRIALVLGVSIVLLTVPLSGALRGSTRALWVLSSVFAACCLLVTGYVLWLEKGQPSTEHADALRITNQTILSRFVSEQRRRTLAQRDEVPLFVPTGIFIQSMSFGTGNNVRMTGYVWQRYARGAHDDVERGFLMPESRSLEIGEPHRTTTRDGELVRWSFKTTLDQHFDYSRYPFGRQYVHAQLWHKEFARNVILVPDLESYNLLNPEATPGLDRDLLLPGWDITDSFFSYRIRNHGGAFGLGGRSGLTDFPGFYFNVGVEKLITGLFVSNLLPLAVVFILLFGVLFLATRDAGRNGLLGFTLDVIIGCAAFFLVAIFSHIAMRRSVGARDIFYLEYYYFVAYAMILFVTMNYVHFTKTPVLLLRFRDNFIPKVIYWPVGALAILVLTLVEFY